VRNDKRRRLERAGWKIGDAAGFLQLSDEERRFIDTKLALADGLRRLRERQGLTQTDVARRIGSSQSRVAKMEVADPTVSTDLLLRSLFRLGANRREVARLLGVPRRTRGVSHGSESKAAKALADEIDELAGSDGTRATSPWPKAMAFCLNTPPRQRTSVSERS